MSGQWRDGVLHGQEESDGIMKRPVAHILTFGLFLWETDPIWIITAIVFLSLALRGCRVIALCLALAVLNGCGMFIPTENQSLSKLDQRQSIAADTTAKVVSAAQSTPANLTVHAAKDGMTVDITQPVSGSKQTAAETTANENADLKARGSTFDMTSIPAFVKIIGLCVAAVFIIGIVWYLRRSSVAVRVATDAADRFVEGAIHRVRSVGMATTDPHEIAKLATLSADLERDKPKKKA